MKRVKESGTIFTEEKLKKNEGAILKFVKIASTKDTEEVGSHNKSLLQVETEEEEVYLEQNNNKVIERSKPTNEILSDKEKTDDIYYSHNDVATWPEVLTHNMRVEIIKLGLHRFQNKEGPFKPATRVIKEGDKEKESLNFLSKKWFFKKLKNGAEVLRSWLLYSNSHSGLYCFCCRLFQSRNDNPPFVFKPFVKFWHLNPCISSHENSKVQKQCFYK